MPTQEKAVIIIKSKPAKTEKITNHRQKRDIVLYREITWKFFGLFVQGNHVEILWAVLVCPLNGNLYYPSMDLFHSIKTDQVRSRNKNTEIREEF
jgi:hypothetical protein